MVGKRKKKFESGEGSQYMTRKQALEYLQLSLKHFRKLCILKGIYPREPKNRKKAQKGKSTVQTLYAKKDIQFLSHEPIISKLRDIKVYAKRMGRVHSLKEWDELKRQMTLHPTLSLDHIVKERYPTFRDALRDLDDCLSLCFLFSTFPSLKHVPRNQSALCRRLTVEFMHACIKARAIRKVFVSIKGYYYQVELMGETITWITPHHFSFQPPSGEDVDFRIMATFVEFYTVLLGFVNFQLYHHLGLIYPPKLADYGHESKDRELLDEEVFVSERISALNIPLCGNEVDVDADDIDQFPVGVDNDEDFEQKRQEVLSLQRLKKLFSGLKFFLSREVPREPMVFLIRSLEGVCSWDATLFPGATFEEQDESITHQIVDRPSVSNQFLSRYYVQPQWIFDCINARELLPVDKYLMGAVLPPHLSPFVLSDRKRVYQPPEEIGETASLEKEMKEKEEEAEKSEDEPEAHKDSVTAGKLYKPDPKETVKAERQHKKLREGLVSRKHRGLYKSMVEKRKNDAKEIWLLRKKRRALEQKKTQKVDNNN